MTRERNIIWFNRLAWAHVIVAGIGVIKYTVEGSYWASAGWSVWVAFILAVALTSPRQVW